MGCRNRRIFLPLSICPSVFVTMYVSKCHSKSSRSGATSLWCTSTAPRTVSCLTKTTRIERPVACWFTRRVLGQPYSVARSKTLPLSLHSPGGSEIVVDTLVAGKREVHCPRTQHHARTLRALAGCQMGLGIKGGRRRAPMPGARLARRPGSEERGWLTRRAADRRSKLPRALPGTCKDKHHVSVAW